jgi:hypothetical protein
MQKEIIKKYPTENHEPFNDISWTHGSLSLTEFNKFIKKAHVSPATHPTACDLYAGDGGMTAIMTDLGWLSKNITCIDLHKPESGSQLATGAKWLFWDLEVLVKKIMNKESLPNAVLKQKEKFDIVVMAYGGVKPQSQSVLTEFFAKNEKNILIIPWDFRSEYRSSKNT